MLNSTNLVSRLNCAILVSIALFPLRAHPFELTSYLTLECQRKNNTIELAIHTSLVPTPATSIILSSSTITSFLLTSHSLYRYRTTVNTSPLSIEVQEGQQRSQFQLDHHCQVTQKSNSSSNT